jgi:hypothetical protein
MITAHLDQPIRDALARGGVIDITTIGRKTGQPHRIEIVFHNVVGRSMPGSSEAIANLAADPHFISSFRGGTPIVPKRELVGRLGPGPSDPAKASETIRRLARGSY